MAPALSDDGRIVSFTSAANNLSPLTSDGGIHVYARELDEGITRVVDLTPALVPGSGSSQNGLGAALSADGRYATFYSAAEDLVGGDLNETLDVFVRDLEPVVCADRDHRVADDRRRLDRGGREAAADRQLPALDPPAARDRGRTGSDRQLPDRQLPDRQLPDRQLPDRQLPDRQLPDRQLPDRQLRFRLADGRPRARRRAALDDRDLLRRWLAEGARGLAVRRRAAAERLAGPARSRHPALAGAHTGQRHAATPVRAARFLELAATPARLRGARGRRDPARADQPAGRRRRAHRLVHRPQRAARQLHPGEPRPDGRRPDRPGCRAHRCADRQLPDRQLPDRQLPDRQLPDRQHADRQLPDRQHAAVGVADRQLPDRQLRPRGLRLRRALPARDPGDRLAAPLDPGRGPA